MVVHGLPPCVQDHDDAEASIPTVLREGLQGLGGSAEQQVVDQQAVVAGQRQQRRGQGEDDVKVLNRQQFQFPGIDPSAALAGPAFRAIAIPARVVAVLFVVAVIESIKISAQFLGAAFGKVAWRDFLPRPSLADCSARFCVR